MENKDKKLFFEEKVIILLIFISMGIIIWKIFAGIGSEENGQKIQNIATYFIGCVVLFSLPYAIKKNALLNIDFLSSKYPEKVNSNLAIFLNVIVAILMIIFTINAVLIFRDAFNNTDVIILEKIINIAPVLAFALAAYRSIQKIFIRR